MALALLASAALTGGLRTWGPSHVGISQQALLLLPDQIKTAFNSTHIHFLGEDGTAESFFGKPFSESGDTVAGPCAANKTTPCSPAAVEAKMIFRDYCYAEDKDERYAKPWPYAIPLCEGPGGKPPPGWTACLPGPRNWTWLYHYFTEPPAADLGIEGRGGVWYLEQASRAFADGNVTKAALHLGCFAHGIEDRSSPYHAFGGFDQQKIAIETQNNLTATCKAHWPEMQPSQRPRCEILFWSPTEPSAAEFGAPGYAPLLLGPTAAAAGVAVGARMAELAATSREIAARPGDGYVVSHLQDSNWWLGTSSNATGAAMSEMGRQSTRLVADVIYTAWVLGNNNTTDTRIVASSRRNTTMAGASSRSEEDWAKAVERAAEQDRNAPDRRRRRLSHTVDAANGVRFLSFYANGNAETAAPGDAARLAKVNANMFSTANISAIEEAWTTHKLPGMLTVDGVWLWHTNPSTKQKEGGLRPGWRAHLQSVLAEALPLVSKGAIRGFFLGDEVCCTQGVPGSNVSSVASIIRHALDSSTDLGAATGGAIIYLNECSRALHPASRGYLGDQLPAAIDAISLDGYCPSEQCSHASQETALMRSIYTHQLFPRLLPHQRVFVVPGLFATANASVPTAQQDGQLVEKWNGYLAWIAVEPRIIGVNPWHYDTWQGGDGLGTGAFPKTLRAVAAFGNTLPSSGGGGEAGW